jgi:hypothetical protein
VYARGRRRARVRPEGRRLDRDRPPSQDQIRALFAAQVEVFPPPGLDRHDSFFARTCNPHERGVAGPALRRRRGARAAASRSCLLRTADPYMTLVGYFNALRELGGSRRIVEDEVRRASRDYGARRVGEPKAPSGPRDRA